MTTIAEQLTTLENVKQDIKMALIDGGVDMTGVPFTEYASKIQGLSGGVAGSGINFINVLNPLNHDDIIKEAKNGMSLIFEPTKYYGTTEAIPVKWIVTGGIDECGDNISGFAFCVPLDVIYEDDGCGDPHMDALFYTIVEGAEANSIREAWARRAIN